MLICLILFFKSKIMFIRQSLRKKLLSGIMAGLMLALMAFQTFILTYAAGGSTGYFDDVDPIHPNYQAIQHLKDEGIVVGYGDGNYGESRNINRAEFLKILMEAGGYEEEGHDCYHDVQDDWYAPYVCKATELGIVEGYSDGTFKPAQDINFVEASKIIVEALDVPFSGSTGGEWFDKYVKALENASAIPFNIDGFGNKLTRSEMAEITWRIMENRTYKVTNTYENIKTGVSVPEVGGELQSFGSCGELNAYLEDNGQMNYRYGLGAADDVAVDADMDFAEESAAPTAGVKAEKGGGGEAAEDYSETNVQVEGVDEADIIKNDGKYIYYLQDETVRVLEAYPPSGMKELDKVEFSDSNFYPSQMYVDGDRLVVIGSTWDEVLRANNYWYGSVTKVYIFDISDKENIEVVRQLAFEGNYSDSRKVDETMYLVVNMYNFGWPEIDNPMPGDVVPLMRDGDNEAMPVVGCGDVRFVPGVIESTDYVIMAAIDIEDPDAEVNEEVILGSSGDIYASRDNLYIAEPKYSWYWSDDDMEETLIHKFALDGIDFNYDGVGRVPGQILNQFSMDEDDGYFRIATTLGRWGSETVNNLYILDDGLNVTGKIEGLAPGEQIHSVRFMGDRAYMVTFEQIDPLFVIDVSNPSNPQVLGELKIPGVSDYLHPYDENHLIGFGLDTLSEQELEEAGFSWFQGIKVSMFDVTDVENPVEMHKIVIGDRGTTSALLYDHKALLFDKEKGFMAFPVLISEIPQQVKDDLDSPWIWGENTFQGAMVLDVDLDDGFSERGRISHYDEDELGENFEYYYDWGTGSRNIERIIYIGDYFYTLSDAMAKANAMDDLNEVKKLEFSQ